MRTVIDIPDECVKQLSELCARERLARAEIIRRAIVQYLKQNEISGGDEAFGLWRDRHEDGLDYEAKLRDEWPS